MSMFDRIAEERLLDAAEQLFAEHGIDGASMRAITHAAGTSVSAANYHFGSKDELVRATFSRRVVELNQRRLDELERIEDPLVLGTERFGVDGRCFHETADRVHRSPQLPVEQRDVV